MNECFLIRVFEKTNVYLFVCFSYVKVREREREICLFVSLYLCVPVPVRIPMCACRLFVQVGVCSRLGLSVVRRRSPGLIYLCQTVITRHYGVKVKACWPEQASAGGEGGCGEDGAGCYWFSLGLMSYLRVGKLPWGQLDPLFDTFPRFYITAHNIMHIVHHHRTI